MNKLCSIFGAALISLTVSGAAGELKVIGEREVSITNNGLEIIKEVGLSDVNTKESSLSQSGKVQTISGKSPYLWWNRKIYATPDEIRIALAGEFPVQRKERIKYSLRIPIVSVKNAKVTIVPYESGKKRVPRLVEIQTIQIINKVAYVAFEQDNGSFSMDFDVNGPMQFQNYINECMAATIEIKSDCIEISMGRGGANTTHGGLFNAQIVVRNCAPGYEKLHGTYFGHYKKILPITRYLCFSPDDKAAPHVFATNYIADEDMGITNKIKGNKGIACFVTSKVAPKYGGGKWVSPKSLKFGTNPTKNFLYQNYVYSDKPNALELPMPDGNYYLTIYAKEASNTSGIEFNLNLNGVENNVKIPDDKAVVLKFPLKVADGNAIIKVTPVKGKWLLNGISIVWLCGLAEDILFKPFIPEEEQSATIN